MKRFDLKALVLLAGVAVCALAGVTVFPLAHAAPAAAPAAEAPAAKPNPAINQFNRLMTPKSERNAPQELDGIHDPTAPGTPLLQRPKEAFGAMPQGTSGNYVDWVKALKDGAINPRYSKDDPKEEAVVFDLDIVREVKGSMPNVVYPHDRHTMWLDCSNCHPDIFIPEKGKNQISMAQILMGQKCGVCHGKVAFPVAECRKCHSQKKGADNKPAK